MRPPRDNNPRLKRFAREMRHEATDAERRLWSILRSRQLGGFKFRRQHPMAGYILDFYCVAAKLAVELDGGQHLDADAQEYDKLRTSKLVDLGVTVLRFADDDLLKFPDAVASAIYEAIMSKGPHPNPLPEYRERG